MSSWQPDLSARSGSRYRAIADALAEDIDRGALPAGSRLPPQRDLARTLGVTVGTVVGMLPGIGPINAIAILLPVVFASGLPAAKAKRPPSGERAG